MKQSSADSNSDCRAETSLAPGRLIVISGPSGVGKTTLCNRLLADGAFRRIRTATTRAPRKGETPDVDYEFIDRDEFEARIAAGRFLEYAEVYGNFYGTPRDAVEAGIARGESLILNIDVQGARQIVDSGLPELTTVFIAPPDLESLARRLEKRSTDAPDVIERRLRVAQSELEEKNRYDHVIINESLDAALAEVQRALEIE